MYNAITQRIDKMTSQWKEFSAVKEARIARWLAEDGEVQMVETFYNLQTTEAGKTPDFFLKLESAFIDKESYTKKLLNELVQQYETSQKDFEEAGILWRPSYKKMPGTFPFFHNLENFAKSIKALQNHLVIYLSPQENDNFKEWTNWLNEALHWGIPEQVRLMIMDTEKFPLFKTLAENNPVELITLKPQLNMDAALRQLAAKGNPKDPGVQFRKAYVALTQAATKGNLKELNQLSKQALTIAKANKWVQMQVVVHLTVGGTLLGKKEFKRALQTYKQAKTVAEKAYLKGETAGGKMMLNAMFGQGSTHIAAKEYREAALVYEQSVPVTEKIKDPFFTLESWRMAGYCYEASKQYEKAWECNQKALDVGLKLDKELRPNSTLPFVGQALLRLTRPLKLENAQLVIWQRMIELVGPEWDQQLPKKEPIDIKSKIKIL